MLKSCKPPSVFTEFVFDRLEHFNESLKILLDNRNPTRNLAQLASPGLFGRL